MKSKYLLEALGKDAIYTYEMDITTGMVDKDIVDKQGKNYTTMLGLTSPCSFDLLVERSLGNELECKVISSDGKVLPRTADLKKAFEDGHTLQEITLYVGKEEKYERIVYIMYLDEESGHIMASVICYYITDIELIQYMNINEENRILTDQNRTLKESIGDQQDLISRLQREVREKEKYQAKLEASQKELKDAAEIIERAGYGIWKLVLHKDGTRTLEANKSYQRILGIDQMNLTPEQLYEFYHSRLSKDFLPVAESDYSQMQQGQIKSRLIAWEHPSKGRIYLRAGGTKLMCKSGDCVLSGYSGDVTEQKLEEDMLNAKLDRALKMAEEASLAKTNFLFNMSHDLRTPMNAIIGYAELMENHWGEKELTTEYLHKLKDSSQFLLSLINNVLEMARIESGKETLNESLWDANKFNDMLDVIVDGIVIEKKLTFTRNIRITHNNVMCDSTKLREIFLNLLSNSIKYTPAGGRVSMDLEEIESNRPGYALFKTVIKDNGIGISKEFLPHLFESFARERNSSQSGIIGTGLGMPIVKRLVEMMNGTIHVESELGKGTTFTVTIPHKIVEAEQLIPDEKEPLSVDISNLGQRRILVVEDNELNAEIAVTIIKDAGLEVEHAQDGAQALEMIKKAPVGYYDLVLMDIQMPVMDGYKATIEIRKLPDERSKTHIIALTANAFEEDKRAALAVGMNGHIAKPIQINRLLKVLVETLKCQ